MTVDITKKKAALLALYDVYDREAAVKNSACTKGCSSCCTQNVTATTLEAGIIVDFFVEQGAAPCLPDQSRAGKGASTSPGLTFNELAAAHLAQREVPFYEIPAWRMASCPFLHNGVCMVYAARPFGCRSFFSTVRCDQTGIAEVTPLQITLNTVFFQIIEELDSHGYWGFLEDLVRFLTASAAPTPEAKLLEMDALPVNLRKTAPIPGLLVLPEERQQVARLLNLLYTTPVDTETFIGEILKKARDHK